MQSGNQAHDGSTSLLGPLLKAAREKAELTLVKLAEGTGLSAPAISNFETGLRIPSVAQILRLSNALALDAGRLMFARTWEQAKGEELEADAPDALTILRANVLQQLRDLVTDSSLGRAKRVVTGEHLTLRDFPNGFNVRTVVVGDRREDPPNTIADILALTAATGDLAYLLDLGLQGTRIRSDKIFKLAQETDLRAKLNHDLIFVASPAANLGSREVNDHACFRFSISPEVREAEKNFENEVGKFAFDPDELKAFAKRKHSPLTRLKEDFARPGFVDPIDFGGSRGFSRGRGSRTDFGVVTLCKNPWSPNGIAILAAGISGPGTAAALKLLGTEGAFEQHPLGGVFSVNVATEAHWEDRYDLLKPVMDTHAYSVEKFEADCRKLPSSDLKEHLSLDEVNELIGLVGLLRERASQARA